MESLIIDSFDLAHWLSKWSHTAAAQELRSFCRPGPPAVEAPVEEPPLGLLVSMAMRQRHDFGLLPYDEQQSILSSMRQMWEEVHGDGFYSPERELEYVGALSKMEVQG